LSEGTVTITNSNNAYKGTTQLAGGTNNKTLTTTDYKTGPLGRFYYPTSGTNLFTLINAGSRTADLAGLYHHTVRFDQVKETNSVVDIGYHYAAVWPSNDGLVGWWGLDEVAGTTAADCSGNGHNGTLLNGPTWTTGTVGGALRFDGTNDSVSVPDAADLRLGTTMTIAFWVQKDANPTNYTRLIGKGSSSLRNYMVWSYSTGTLLFQFQRTDGAYLNLFSTTALQVGSWYHVACTYNGSNAAIYINGVLDASLAFSGTPVTSTDPLTFAYGGWNEYHKGLLDDVRIYNRALSASEIASLVNPILLDTDGDVIPDYLEDRNGNGSYDSGSGETDWQTSNSGISGAAGLQVFTPLK